MIRKIKLIFVLLFSITLQSQVCSDFPEITTTSSTICSDLSSTLAIEYTPLTICDMNITPTTIPLGDPIPGFSYGGMYGGHHYYVYNTPTSWTQGELICRQNGGYLVSINDINENAFVSNLTNNNIWIGLFRDPTTCQFRWLDCLDINFTNWRSGEPNSGPCGEPYTQIIRGCNFGLNTWNNLGDNSSNGSCYSNMVPIMEIDPVIYNNPISTTTTYLWSNGETTSSIDITPSSTTNYWVDITSGSLTCRKEITITVNPNITPIFTQVTDICSGDSSTTLPTTSNNGYTGTWSPALNNTATTTYTFTPDADQCATTATMTINVNPIITPTFTQVTDICSGDSSTTLPTTSNNGYTGTWSPALNNTATTTYTFTPDADQCATTATMTINVNSLPNIPTGDPQQNFCAIDNPIVGDLILSNNFIHWYSNPTGGTPLNLNTPLSNGISLYAASYNSVTNCENSNRFQVTTQVENPILPNISSQQKFCLENNLTLEDISTNGVSMNWYDSPVGGSPLLPTFILENGSTIYGAAINISSGCESKARIPLAISINNSNLEYNNLITVDGNDLNKELIIEGIERFSINAIEVYNRYGNLVWSSNNYNNITNTFKGMANVEGVVSKGSYLPTGTYFFVLKYPNPCEKKVLKGFLHIDNKL